MTKKLKFPKTLLDDYIKYREAVQINLSYFMKNNISFKERKEVFSLVNRFYRDSIFAQDFYPYKRVKCLEDFLIRTNFFSNKDIKRAIRHEKEHVKVIKKLGYGVERYSAMLLFNPLKNKPSFALAAHMNLSAKISYEDFKRICLAPKNPSLIDLAFV